MTVGNEVGYLSVAVAGDVLQGSVAGRTLVQTLDRHDREELVDSPTCLAGSGTERSCRNTCLARILSNPLSSSGTCFMCLARLLISWHIAPVHRLNLDGSSDLRCRERRAAKLLRRICSASCQSSSMLRGFRLCPYLIQVLHQLVVGFLCLKLLWHFRQGSCLQDIDDQYRVMG